MSGDQRAFPMYFHGAASPQGGMSLRDYLAAKAMQGFLADSNVSVSNDANAIKLAKSAYGVADAMIKVRDGDV